jgi:hypothetical protein
VKAGAHNLLGPLDFRADNRSAARARECAAQRGRSGPRAERAIRDPGLGTGSQMRAAPGSMLLERLISPTEIGSGLIPLSINCVTWVSTWSRVSKIPTTFESARVAALLLRGACSRTARG